MLIEMFNRSTIIFWPYFPGVVIRNHIVVLLFFCAVSKHLSGSLLWNNSLIQ